MLEERDRNVRATALREENARRWGQDAPRQITLQVVNARALDRFRTQIREPREARMAKAKSSGGAVAPPEKVTESARADSHYSS